jgi:hypothetical protein
MPPDLAGGALVLVQSIRVNDMTTFIVYVMGVGFNLLYEKRNMLRSNS